MERSTILVEQDLVQQLSDSKSDDLVPVVIFISLLMVSGIVGNIMVWIYYGFASKRTTNTFFIVVLATYDLLSCSISMPTEMVDVVRYYTFPSGTACKVLRFINYVTAIGSGLTLLAIAVDRYHRIHKPSGAHMTLRKARCVSVILAVTAVVLSWPTLLFYDSTPVPLTAKQNVSLQGMDCTTSKDSSLQMYLLLFNGIHFIIFLVSSVAVCVMYSVIGKAIFRHRKALSRYHTDKMEPNINSATDSLTHNTDVDNEDEKMQETSATTSSPASSDSFTVESSEQVEPPSVVKESLQSKETITFPEVRIRAEFQDVKLVKLDSEAKERATSRPRKSITMTSFKIKNDGIDHETVKITLVMIAVTSLFIISFLPYLCLIFWRNTMGEHEEEYISGANLVLYEIGLRSFLLNSGLNPWIYGIFNSNFRQYFREKFCQKRS